MDKPFAITLDIGTSRANKTGSWRTERAVYTNRMPPCNDSCPAGENVQAWLYDAEAGGEGYERAWRTIMEDNPFPAVMGRVCYHPCETACNRGQLDEAVGINSVERFVGDEAIRQGWTVSVDVAPTGKRVLVVGAGPSGLAAAYHLARRGHSVTIKEAGPMAGGMMRFGIPRYRLARDVLDAEVQRILDLGVTLELDTKVSDLESLRRDYDAVFLAVGAQLGKRAYIPAGEAAHVLDAVSMLRDLEAGEKPLLGRRVAVYGGGNTAMDAARTAKRLGASEAVVVYRRTQDRMPAHESELREAEDEGVLFKWLTTIKQVDSGRLLVERMELDDSGFPQPTGEVEELDADSLVLALGQETDLTLLDGVPGLVVEDGVVAVGGDMMTGCAGVFAGGDMVPYERSVTVAVGHGKRAARQIDAWLSSEAPEPAVRPALATFDTLNTWYYSDAPRAHRPVLDRARRESTFDEVVLGHDETTALLEARRCLSCGNCFECDNCYGVCPDNAVIKLGTGEKYLIDLDYCKGCGLCVAECPSGAIQMVPEQI
ncbi:NAD(P)-binding protein [Nocardioides cavernae]|uniref:NAD(P)-binding protein n=1 Tax=Nocardioides TaxID=1839 RepID=UPI000A7FD15D|nr:MULTISPECIES: NAD(P)-binding protein [Nocardioides]MCK9825370.1 NAD(P)-binding protein [Nocardioides cavernae]